MLGPDAAFNLGIGYEHYIGVHWSIGGEIIYHNFISEKGSIEQSGQTTSGTLPYPVDGSVTSVNFAFLYHF